jgi:CRP-like cAMP-binding protein
MLAGNYGKVELPSPSGNWNRRGQMISSYPPAIRRQLLSKHFLISTMPEGALDDLVKFTAVARFKPHRLIFSKSDGGDCLYGVLSGRAQIYSDSAEGRRSC